MAVPAVPNRKPLLDVSTLSQSWPLPRQARPIVIIGAGGIVNDAHLPAYAKAGFPVVGIYDIDASRSRATAERFGIPRVIEALDQCFRQQEAVLDIAVPPQSVLEILEAVPEKRTVLIQKPLGLNLEQARAIREIVRRKQLCAAVNFQFRFSPMMLALRSAASRGLLGEILDVEFHLRIYTPWHLFPYLASLERVEILVHSIHYLDWIRSIMGEPAGVYARTVGHPSFPALRSTRSSIILDYGESRRVLLSINHNFRPERRHQEASVCVTGSRGAAVGRLGLLLDYPAGEPDALEIVSDGYDWTPVPLQGRWFPDAFIGTMANLQRYAAGEDDVLHTSVEDACKTMAVVEACYESSARGAVAVPL